MPVTGIIYLLFPRLSNESDLKKGVKFERGRLFKKKNGNASRCIRLAPPPLATDQKKGNSEHSLEGLDWKREEWGVGSKWEGVEGVVWLV